MISRDEKIGIIGAGCSGLAAAHYLKKAGFKNITVIEKENRLGGKCCTINYKGRTYELGAMMGASTYETILEIMKDIGINNNGPVLYRGFFDSKGKKIQQIKRSELKEFKEQFDRLPNILKEYKEVLNPGFKNIDERLCVTFSKWCENNDIPLLEKVYRPSFTAFGYGYVDEIPAAYILKFLDYKTLQDFIKITHLITWVDGVQGFLEKLGQNFDIRLSSQVLKINRGKTVNLETEIETLEFDRLIITSSLDETDEFMDLCQEETSLFSKIQYKTFKVFAFFVDNFPKVSGYVPEFLNSEYAGHIMVWYYRWQDLEINNLVTVYAIAKEGMSTRECRNIIQEDLKRMGAKVRGLYTHKSWKYFPHVDCETLKSGFYDRLEAMQGINNTYYAGEIMSFSCLEECAVYSKYIVDTYFK